MKSAYLYIVAFLWIPFAGLAQEEIEGRITNARDVSGIHILNKNSRFNAISNHEGVFTISANKNDTLVVSSVHYMPEKIIVTAEVFQTKKVFVTLIDLVNELDEVFIGPQLTGNLERDLKKIETVDDFNFDDVGIPGFMGKPEEKIAPVVPVIPVTVNLEALYKHLSGYYKKLRLRRKWEAQNTTVALLLTTYGTEFFEESYGIPENRLYDFMLFCMETSSLQSHFKNENFAGVLSIFQEKGMEYKTRLSEKKE